jgi:proliferating cell nuclear antigen PCNA
MTQSMTRMFKQLLSVVSGISELATIRFEPTGVHLQTMDISRVCLVEVRLPDGWFETYKCPASVQLSTSLALFVKMLNCLEHGQRALLRHLERKGQQEWELELSGGEGTFPKHFGLPRFDLDDDLMDVPPPQADTDFQMDATRWAKIMNELAIFGAVVRVHCGDEGTTLSSQDVTQGTKMSCLIGLDDVESYEACDEEFAVFFPVKLLQHAASAREVACLGPTSSVTVHLTEDRPIDLEFDLGNGASARFIVAPRLDDDGE